MKFLQQITLLGLLFFASCDPSLDFILLEEPPKLVVWGYLYPSEVVKVNVSKTVAIGDTSNRLVNDATVILFENNQIVDTLTAIGNGNYISSKGLKPVESRSYFIEIHKEGFDVLRSISSIVPPAPRIDSVSLSFIDVVRGYAMSGAQTTLIIQPHGRVFVAYNDEGNPTGYIGAQTILFSKTGEAIPLTLISHFRPLSCDDYYMDSIIYRKDCTLPNTVVDVHNEYFSREVTLDSCRVKLCHTTNDAVLFHKKIGAMYEIVNSSGFDIFNEPAIAPSVIENGYGYFGVCNCVDSTFHF